MRSCKEVKTDNRAVGVPCWLMLERRRGTITAYRSADGHRWQRVGSDAVDLEQSVYVGLAATSHARGTMNVSVFENVSVGGPLGR